MPTNKLKSSPLKVPKSPSLPCPFSYSLPVIRPPTVPNIISTKTDKVALPNNLRRSLDPKFTCQHSFSSMSHQAHLRVTDFWKNKATVSQPLACLFFLSKVINGHLAFTYSFIYNRGKKENCTRERNEHLKWISQRFPSSPSTPPQENVWLRRCECKVLLKVNQHYRKGSHELLLMPTKQTWALGNINIIYMMFHICFLSICYKVQHPTQGIKQSTFFCLYAANVWVSFFFFFF